MNYFGQLSIDIGMIDFLNYIKIENANQTCEDTINKSIENRAVTTTSRVTRVNRSE